MVWRHRLRWQPIEYKFNYQVAREDPDLRGDDSKNTT